MNKLLPFCIVTLITFLSCNQPFQNSRLNDARFTSGRDSATGQKLKPKRFAFRDYNFICGYSAHGATLGMYYGNREILFKTSADGYFDSVAIVNINADNIPDFYI